MKIRKTQVRLPQRTMEHKHLILVSKYVIRHACVRSLQRIVQQSDQKGILIGPEPDGSVDEGSFALLLVCSFDFSGAIAFHHHCAGEV